MKEYFALFAALLVILTAADACAEMEGRVIVSELYEEVVEDTGSTQSDWERAAKNADTKEAEEDGQKSEDVDSGHKGV
jgi:hypothetical protein